MTTLLDLAARVEGSGGECDPELVALIRCAVFGPSGAYVKQSPINGAWCVYEVRHNGRERSWEPRDLTREQRLGDFMESVDAALSLVPKGWRTAMVSEMEHREGWEWRLVIKSDVAPRFGMPGQDGIGATPALALTAACLKALATLPKDPSHD